MALDELPRGEVFDDAAFDIHLEAVAGFRELVDAGDFQKACAERGLRLSRYLGNSPRLRMVTHANVSRADVDAALAIMSAVLSGKREPVTAAD